MRSSWILGTLAFIVNLRFASACPPTYESSAKKTAKTTEKPKQTTVTEPTITSSDMTTTYLPYEFIKDDVERNILDAWGGFDPPPELLDKWREWRDEYNQQDTDDQEGSAGKHAQERGSGSGWPSEWADLGHGSGGSKVPPWAYAPINIGLPEFCYQRPRVGHCDQEIKRWAYNAYTDNCLEFTYSGCDENQNNFLTKQKCEESCMAPPVSGCEHETDTLVEVNMDFRRCNV